MQLIRRAVRHQLEAQRKTPMSGGRTGRKREAGHEPRQKLTSLLKALLLDSRQNDPALPLTGYKSTCHV